MKPTFKLNLSVRRRYLCRHPDDLPLKVIITRESKGVYICDIAFRGSNRFYATEVFHVDNKKLAMQRLRRMYPKIKEVKAL
jgi:hypothetical protein